MREEVQALRSTLDQKVGFENIIGHSKALLYALETAARAAQSDVTVLLSGETGTGKEMIARGIHHCSSRKTMPFVTIDCGAITRGTLEPEWFGHIADIRTAVGGTVFLDEVGDLSLEVQVKLLDLLQQYQTATATETARITHDVRIIAASNRNLLSMVQRGTFREDLFYRLNVVPIDVPPLRERTEDIAELTQHFFAITREKHARQHLRLPSLLLPYLLAYLWPGNVRELENLIERFAAVAPNDEVGLDDLPEAIRRARPVIETLRVPLPARGLNLESVERDLMLRALIMCKWNQSQAARYLDVSCKTLIGRMEKFGLEPA